MKKFVFALMAILVLSVFSIAACQKAGTQTDQQTQPAQETPEEAVKEFNVQAFRFGFNPSTIEVNKGDKVKITLASSDTTHGFSISEYGISETISPGQTKTVEFTADKEGTFAFFCSVYCGSGHGGMRGTLIVR